MTYTIQIIDPSQAEGVPPAVHYLRRIELPDISEAVSAIDSALAIIKPARKPRSDKGKTRGAQQ